MDRISRHSWLGSITPDSDNDDLPNFDQIVQLMEVVNSMVKGGQFTPQLANAIFALCQQLKQHGPTLEQTHKSDLNKVFVSLRQACCRDHGQLGTPCRLKIMELVELRAMHWRSNLAHSQYYVNRPEQHDSLGASSPLSMGFPTQSMTPTTFSPSLFLPDMTTQTTQAAHQTSPYFLIPAAVPGGFVNPLLPGLLQQPLFASALAQNQAAAEVLLRNKQIKKPTVAKPMQLRHEMIIRNADSGKIMGVKGRRVALVEQITNTVISFQKVDPKAKERTLTITASTTEAIEHAKQLVEETIRRNTSPVRPEAAALLGIDHSISNDSPSMGDDESSDDEDDRETQRGQDISIETTQDGVLKLCCSDPHVLQAAQEALSEYLRMRTRPSAEEREKKKERRKSMPLQTGVKEEKVETTERRPGLERARSLGGSTPNLQEQAHKAAMTSRMRAPFGPCYGREALLAQQQHLEENNELVNQVVDQVSQIAPEILRDSVQN